MFEYLKRKFLGKGALTPESKRARLTNKESKGNEASSSRGNTKAANHSSHFVGYGGTTKALFDLAGIDYDASLSKSESKRARLTDKEIKGNKASSSKRNTKAINDISQIKTVEKCKKKNRRKNLSSIKTVEEREEKNCWKNLSSIEPVENREEKNCRANLSSNCTKNISKMPEEIQNNPTLWKYWLNRYKLFSKYDEGIKLDKESWYSVTPEKISKEIARRCQCDVIIDAFCGAGGNTIQFAFVCKKVIAIDIDSEKIKLAKHNALIYGVADRIKFIVADFFEIASSLTADVVFLSPPWGGPSYKKFKGLSLSQIIKPYGGKHLYNVAKQISDNIAYYLPRNINETEVKQLEKEKNVRIDNNYLENRMVAVAITAYFGDFVEDYDDEWEN